MQDSYGFLYIIAWAQDHDHQADNSFKTRPLGVSVDVTYDDLYCKGAVCCNGNMAKIDVTT